MWVTVSYGAFVAYYRVSTRKQGKGGLGIAAQREAVSRYLNGGSREIIAEFTEVESRRKKDRPELAKALAKARLHRCPIVVAKVDRLTRSLSFLHQLLDAGVDVRFADLPTIEDPTGRFMLTQMASVAELEAGFISTRTKAALGVAKARGVDLGGKRPGQHSFSKVEQRRGAEAVQRTAAQRATDLAPVIEELRLSGSTSLKAIADELNARRIPTALGGQWSRTQVARVLTRLRPFDGANDIAA